MDIHAGSINRHQGPWCKFKSLFGHKHDRSGKKQAGALAEQAAKSSVGKSSSTGDLSASSRASRGQSIRVSTSAPGTPTGGIRRDASVVTYARAGKVVHALPVPTPASGQIAGHGETARRHSSGPVPKADIMSAIKVYTSATPSSDQFYTPEATGQNAKTYMTEALNKELPGTKRAEFLRNARANREYAVALGGMDAAGKLSAMYKESITDPGSGGTIALPKYTHATFWSDVQKSLDQRIGKTDIRDLSTEYSGKQLSGVDRMAVFVRISNSVRQVQEGTNAAVYWKSQMDSIYTSKDEVGNLPADIWSIHAQAMRQYL